MTEGFALSFLKRWLASGEPEPPILVHSRDAAQLAAMLETVAREVTCELVRLTATGATIPIQMVRGVTTALSRSTLAERRLVVVEEAERLSHAAAQALLKPLEEPTAATRWLLHTHYPRRLSATIRSRCAMLRLAAAAEPSHPQSEIEQLASDLQARLYSRGPSVELRLAYMRLRDYYHIVSLRGNEKLAREVALAFRPDDLAA